MKRGCLLSLALIAILTAAIVVTWARLPQTHDLARLAKRIPGTSSLNIGDYCWAGNSSRLIVWNWTGTVNQAFAINTANGKSTPLPAMDRGFGDYPALSSPDGEWILSGVRFPQDKTDFEDSEVYDAVIIKVVKANGSRVVTYKINHENRGFDFKGQGWLRDSRHYMVYLWSGTGLVLRIYDVNNAGLFRTLLVHDPQSMIKGQIESSYDEPRWVMTSDQHLLLINDIDPGLMTVCDINLNFNPVHIQRTVLPLLPKGAGVMAGEDGFVPSPDGKRIAWHFHFIDRQVSSPNIWEQFWTVHIRHKARLLPEGIPTEEIWASSIDGRGMHQIAYQADTGDSDMIIVNMKWTPDGKSLSFMRNGSGIPGAGNPIYTIPAD